MNTRSDTRRTITSVSAVLSLLLTVFSAFLLRFLFGYFVQNNAALSWLELPLSVVIELLNTAAMFLPIAAAVCGIWLYGIGHTKGLIALCGVQMLLSFLCSLLVSLFCTTPALFLANLGYLLRMCGLNFLVYVLVTGLMFLFTFLVRRRTLAKGAADLTLRGEFFARRHPLLKSFLLCTSTYVGYALVTAIIQTVRDLSDYGLPVNAEEWVYEITPYAEAVVYFFFVYAVMVGTGYLLQRRTAVGTETDRT